MAGEGEVDGIHPSESLTDDGSKKPLQDPDTKTSTTV